MLAIGAVGAMVTAMVVLGYDHALGADRNVEHARAMALATLIAASATITISLSGLRTRTSQAVVLASLASLVTLVQLPALARLMHVEPLHLGDWGLAASGGASAGIAAALASFTLRGPARVPEREESR
jgi:Ca2+-transporting ATPase